MPGRRRSSVPSRSSGSLVVLSAAAWVVVGSAAIAGDDEAIRRPGLRRPTALVLADQGRRLWVANGRSGSVSLIDTSRLELLAEFPVGGHLADLIDAPGPDRMLAIDDGAHELLILATGPSGDPSLEVVHRVPVSPYPVRATSSDAGRRCSVSALWSRRLDVFDVPLDAAPRRTHSIELPFEPREQLALDEGRVLVADAFGGRLAVVDVTTGELVRQLELPIHNIGGLALSADGSQLAIAHQSLNPYANTARENVLWGVLVSNRLLLVDLQVVLSPSGDVSRRSRVLDLGDLTSPAGDPNRVLVTPGGELVVSLAGTGRIALGRADWPRLDHVRLQRRPTALAAGDDGRLFVANTLSDSISVVDVASRKRLGDVSLGPPAELSQADRGELLFFDAELSLRGWMSCHSCHTDGHANGTVADTLGDGGFGAPKRVPSLLGVGNSGPWAWNGSAAELEDQVRKSVHSTLQNRGATPDEIRALASFLRTLEPPALPLDAGREDRRRGEAVFFRSGCDRCHTPPAFTSTRARDVGLLDEVGNRRFNPPSLRGVRHRSSFLHDGRARSLPEVFSAHGHPGVDLSATEIDQLVAFLSTL